MVPSGPCISICMVLPGLASHWHTGLLNPFGPHHCATCLGSVHASQTSSIGALIRRVSVIWRVAVLFFVCIFFIFSLQCVQIFFQRIQFYCPEFPVLFNPICNLIQTAQFCLTKSLPALLLYHYQSAFAQNFY